MIDYFHFLGFFRNLGWPEILIILLFILLLFGAKKLPEIARSLGRSLKEFKKATRDIKKELDVEEDIEKMPPDDSERKTEEIPEKTPPEQDLSEK